MPTVCPLGQPKKAIGHESQIEPWLAIASTLLESAEEAAGKTRTKMTPGISPRCEKENHARAKRVAAANRGWMLEKISPWAGRQKCFYLTSPFIEPDGHVETQRRLGNLPLRQKLCLDKLALQNFAISVTPAISSRPPRNLQRFKGCWSIRNQPKLSITNDMMRAAVTVKPTNCPAPTLVTSVSPA